MLNPNMVTIIVCDDIHAIVFVARGRYIERVHLWRNRHILFENTNCAIPVADVSDFRHDEEVIWVNITFHNSIFILAVS